MDLFKIAKDKGLVAPQARGFMPHTESKAGGYVVDYDRAARSLARDAAMSTVPTVGVPSALLTYIDPNVVDILFSPKNATRLFPETKKGDWADQYYNFPMAEVVGRVGGYNDFSNAPTSDVNNAFAARQNFVFETNIKVGQREMAEAEKANLALMSQKQTAAAEIIARAHNSFYLKGVKGIQSYGILNDPNLDASETPHSINGKVTWSDKAAAEVANIGNVIYNDIAKLINRLLKNNAGNVTPSDKMRLGIAPSRMGYLTFANQYGKTAQELLAINYPNLEIVQIPELETQAGAMLYLCVPTYMGINSAECAYGDKMRFLNMETRTSSYMQKVVGSTWGGVIKRPTMIATMTGI